MNPTNQRDSASKRFSKSKAPKLNLSSSRQEPNPQTPDNYPAYGEHGLNMDPPAEDVRAPEYDFFGGDLLSAETILNSMRSKYMTLHEQKSDMETLLCECREWHVWFARALRTETQRIRAELQSYPSLGELQWNVDERSSLYQMTRRQLSHLLPILRNEFPTYYFSIIHNDFGFQLDLVLSALEVADEDYKLNCDEIESRGKQNEQLRQRIAMCTQN